MGIRELLEDRWSKAGQPSGAGDFKFTSTVDALITLVRDDGLWLTASSESINGTEVRKLIGPNFQARVNPSSKSGGIDSEDSISVIISAGKQLSESDDTIRITTTRGLPRPTLGRIKIDSVLVGLDLTFQAKASSSGFISGEVFSNEHYYHCGIVLFIGRRQI